MSGSLEVRRILDMGKVGGISTGRTLVHGESVKVYRGGVHIHTGRLIVAALGSIDGLRHYKLSIKNFSDLQVGDVITNEYTSSEQQFTNWKYRETT